MSNSRRTLPIILYSFVRDRAYVHAFLTFRVVMTYYCNDSMQFN